MWYQPGLLFEPRRTLRPTDVFRGWNFVQPRPGIIWHALLAFAHILSHRRSSTFSLTRWTWIYYGFWRGRKGIGGSLTWP